MCGVMAGSRARGKRVVIGMAALVVAPSGAGAAPTIETHRVAVTHRSGGELAFLAGRDLVATADRATAGPPEALRPSISLVDARRRTQRGSVALWNLPWAPGPGGFAIPHVPSGLDAHAATGTLVSTNSSAGTITVTNESDAAADETDLVSVGAHPFGVEIDRRGRLAYVASYLEHRVDVVDLRARRVVDRIDGLRHPTKLALDERRGRLYVGNADRPPSAAHAIAVVDLTQRSVVGAVPVDANSRPALDPRTGTVYAASFATGRIAVIDPDDLTAPRALIATGTTPHGLGVDHRRGLLYAPNLLANTVTVIDARQREVIETVAVDGVPLGVDVDHARGWAWVSLRDRSELVALRLVRSAATHAADRPKPN